MTFAGFSLLSLSMAGIGLYAFLTDEFPKRESLLSASGAVTAVQSGKSGVAFTLEGQVPRFHYLSKGKAIGVVEQGLAPGPGRIVGVLYEDKGSAPVLSDGIHYNVFEITLNGKPVRSYEQVRAAWHADNQIGAWLAGVFLLAAGYFIRLAFIAAHAPRLLR